MTTFKRLAWVDLGNVLTTELNSLANGGFSALGTAYDNSSGLYLYGMLLINLATLTPTAGAYVQPFMVLAADGTNYDDAPSSTQPGLHHNLPPLSPSTGAGAKRLTLDGRLWGLPGFPMPQSLLKFALLGAAGVAFNASTNTVKLYGAYEQAV